MDYLVLIIPIIVVFATQILKLSIDGIKGNLNFRNLFLTYGGMPSSHTAIVTSLTTVVALVEGLSSAVFAVAAIFSFIIIRDAFTFRKHLEDKSRIVNQLVKKLPESEQKKYPTLPNDLGHTVSEVIVGIVWGFSLTVLLNWLITNYLY
ncbi:divergent PAP2 family protein [Patescibacteria group bacterium]|nr:divergent PAP2 family protein [Patescibacteria group bacterium]